MRRRQRGPHCGGNGLDRAIITFRGEPVPPCNAAGQRANQRAAVADLWPDSVHIWHVDQSRRDDEALRFLTLIWTGWCFHGFHWFQEQTYDVSIDFICLLLLLIPSGTHLQLQCSANCTDLNTSLCLCFSLILFFFPLKALADCHQLLIIIWFPSLHRVNFKYVININSAWDSACTYTFRMNIWLWLQSASQWNPSQDPSTEQHPLFFRVSVVGEGGQKPWEESSTPLWRRSFFEGFSWQCQCVKSEICSAVLNRQWHEPAASGSSFYPTAVGFYKWTIHILFDIMFATDHGQAISKS